RARVQDGIMGFEALLHVIGVENGDLGGAREVASAHHADIGPRDGENTGAAPGSRRYGGNGLVAAGPDHAMARQERGQVRGGADGAHARTAAAVGNAEGLVQIEVAYVRAHAAGAAKSHLGVHVGAVHVNLAAVRVHDGAYFADALFEHAVGGGVGGH